MFLMSIMKKNVLQMADCLFAYLTFVVDAKKIVGYNCGAPSKKMLYVF